MALQQPVDFPIENVRAKRLKRRSTALTRSEVKRLIGVMSVKYRLMAKLLYGSGRFFACTII
jgi:integrase